MRCFVACFLTPDCAGRLQDELHSSWAPSPGVSLVSATHYHLTLRFLGEVAGADLSGILEAVAALEGVPVRVEVVGLGGFPRAGRANVVFAGLAPQRDLQRWYAELATLPGPGSAAAFVAHVTLARSRKSLAVPQLAGLEAMTLDLAAPALYESVPASRGVRYQLLQA